jgi:hypothetical protein
MSEQELAAIVLDWRAGHGEAVAKLAEVVGRMAERLDALEARVAAWTRTRPDYWPAAPSSAGEGSP